MTYFRCMVKRISTMLYLCFCTQAQQHNVAIYVAGFVIGTGPLCVAVGSPLVGYFVSRLVVAASWHLFITSLFYTHCSFLIWGWNLHNSLDCSWLQDPWFFLGIYTSYIVATLISGLLVCELCWVVISTMLWSSHIPVVNMCDMLGIKGMPQLLWSFSLIQQKSSLLIWKKRLILQLSAGKPIWKHPLIMWSQLAEMHTLSHLWKNSYWSLTIKLQLKYVANWSGAHVPCMNTAWSAFLLCLQIYLAVNQLRLSPNFSNHSFTTSLFGLLPSLPSFGVA